MNKLIIFIIMVAGLGLLWSLSGFVSLGGENKIVNSPVNYERAGPAEQTVKCQTPPGYTDEEWLDHMSHHPDRYAECLNQ